ncbi:MULTISPECIES: twin-arginine translocase subunit TatC [unclassified Sphingomonas]|uniref:twin-arginine translocase subunit TatC n=1 Tax=Sphingomonas TaxID=13687 RepID=UPI002A6AAE00|nr:twin-arginine translocase subunit TatC [Sphingomonas sp. CFBP8993]MDY0958338.1 twin-arginine translocase subunit TatC [Sphingomonas sp. CFBP8993]
MSEHDEIDASRAPLLEHLIELRRRLLYCIVAVGLAFGVSMYFSETIFGFLARPLLTAGQGKLIYTQIFEAFFVQVKVSFFTAVMISFPVIANQLWQFVAPGLYRKEKRALLPFLVATPVLFLMGAAMAYYVAVPMALHFALGFDGMVGGVKREALPGVGNYLSFIMQFLFAFGLAFLLPVLLMLLERAGIVTRKQLIGARRYAIVAATAIAAVLTPPDLMSQVLLAVPLIILYELAIIGIWFTERARSKQAAVAEDDEEADATV